jgi:hypothetical protein
MKIVAKILCCLLMGILVHATENGQLEQCVDQMKEIERESYKAIDDIFARIRHSVISKEEKSDRKWFKYLKDNELQDLLTTARIHSFDNRTTNIMPEKVDAYLQKKIRGDLQLIVVQGADIEGVKKFLTISMMMCELSDGVHCKELIRAIKSENRQIIDELKQQKEAQQKEACLARENMLAQIKK